MKKILFILFFLASFFIVSPVTNNNTANAAGTCVNRNGNPPVCQRHRTQICTFPSGVSCGVGTPGCTCRFVCDGLNTANCKNCNQNATQNACGNPLQMCNNLPSPDLCLCVSNACIWQACNPTSNCGANWCGGGFDDGCGGTYNCGSCSGNDTCQNAGGGNGRCACVPNWTAWQNGACGGGGCSGTQMRQTRTDGCGNTDSRCVDDTAGAWQNGTCGGGTCASTEVRQTRNTTYGCLPNSRCVADSYTQANWQDGTCGGGTCTSTQLRQTRNSAYSCLPNSRCVDDAYTQGSWQDDSCGGSGGGASCSNADMHQHRNSSYSCLTNARCDTGTVGAWQNYSCGGGGCGANEILQKRLTSHGCTYDTRCVPDTYTQGTWQNDSCGANIGGVNCNATQMHQHRNSAYSCLAENRCDTGTVGAWQNGACGGGSCGSNQRLQTKYTEYGCTFSTQCVSDNTCGNYGLSGTVFQDTSGNGVLNPGSDPGISSVNVYRSDAGGSVIQDLAHQATTNAGGVYDFGSIPHGTYQVKAFPNVCRYTASSSNPDSVTLGPATNSENFGFTLNSYVVSGYVYLDNGNNVLDGGDRLVGTTAGERAITFTVAGQGSDTVSAGGTYNVSGLGCSNSYTLSIGNLPAHYFRIWNSSSGNANSSVTIDTLGSGTGQNPTVNWLIGAGYSIQGTVYKDSNNDHALTASDQPYTGGATLTVVGSSPVRSDVSDGAGNYNITDNPSASYQVSISGLTGGYTIDPNYPSPRSVTVSGADANLNFLVDLPTYTINGGVFIDDGSGGGTANDGIKNGGESYVPGSISISGTDGAGNAMLSCPQGPGGADDCLKTGAAAGGAGKFTFDKLRTPNNSFSASYTPSIEYYAEFPSPPNITNLSIGNEGSATACASQSYRDHGALCQVGNINNLNFAVTEAKAWLQTIGGDIRWNGSYNNTIPPASTSPTCGAYNSLSSGSSDPGIVYMSGNSSSPFGGGSASVPGWNVRGQPYPSTRYIRTSYSSYLARAQKNGTPITMTDANFCESGSLTNNCQPKAGLAKGIYTYTGNLSLGNGTDYTFGSACVSSGVGDPCAYTILVNGSVTINSNLKSPKANRTILIVVASQDITVSTNIGVNYNDSTTTNLEGIFSADRTFSVPGKATPPDTRLNIAGAVISNANPANGAGFNLGRTLQDNNKQCPAFSVIQRSDFVISYPKELTEPSYNWTEVAPDAPR